MRVISIEEHWTTPEIDAALRAAGTDPSLALNDRGDIPARLLDLDDARLAAMDAAGVDVQVVSLSPPGTGTLPAAQAAALAREANDRAADAVARHPDRLRAMTALPLSDPAAAIAELDRLDGSPAHVGVMTYGRTGDRPLDDPAFDALLGRAAARGLPVFVHPQVPPAAVREASYSGLGSDVDLALSTFGWGWHAEAGVAALRLILAGTFDRHPDLQIVLGHWGELLLFALDRVDALSHVATHLQRPVADYVATNVWITASGMLVPRLLHHALDFHPADRVLLSGDYPFHRLDAAEVDGFLATLPEDRRHAVAHGNAERLFRLAP